MSGVTLPLELAIAPVINTEEDWRPSMTVKKGPVTTNMSINNASSVTDNSMLFQGIIPPNDMTCIKRNLLIEYEVLVKVENLPYTLDSYYAKGTQGTMTQVGVTDLCLPLPTPLLCNGQRFNDPAQANTLHPSVPTKWANGSWTYQPGLALRPLPLQSNCSSIVLTVNGTSITYPAREVSPLLPYLNWVDMGKNKLSTVPFYPAEGPFYREPRCGPSTDWYEVNGLLIDTQAAGKYLDYGTTGTYNSSTSIDPFGGETLYFSDNTSMWQTGGRSVQWEVVAVQFSKPPDPQYPTNPGSTGYTSTGPFTIEGTGPVQYMTPTYDFLLKARVRESIPVGPFRLDDASKETGITRVNNLSLQLNYDRPVKMLALATALTGTWPFSDDSYHDGTLAIYGRNISIVWPTAYTIAASITSMPFHGTTATAMTPTLNLEYNTADPITQSRSPNFSILPIETYQSYKAPNIYSITTMGDVRGIRQSKVEVVRRVLPAIRSTFIPSKLIVYLSPDPSFHSDPTFPSFEQSTTGMDWDNAILTGSTDYQQDLVDARMSNHYLRIHSVSVDAFNQVALCSTLTEADLHERSVRNGYKGSFDQWTGAWGSILILDFAEDLCLQTAMAAGQNTNCNIQVTITFSASSWYRSIGTDLEENVVGWQIPPYKRGIQYQATQLLVYNGSAVVGAGQMTVTQEGPTEAQVLRLLSVQKARKKTSEMPQNITAGSLTQEKVMNPTDDDAVDSAPAPMVMPSTGSDSLSGDNTVTAEGGRFKRRHRF